MINIMKDSAKTRYLRFGIYFAVITLSVIIDYVTKFLIVGNMKLYDSITVIPGVLDFKYILNDGATGGMLSDHRWVFMSVSTVAIIAILVYMFFSKTMTRFAGVSLALIAGGGIGNMIDRVAKGEVVDFFDVTAFDFFPFNTVFNMADIFVCVGCAMLILALVIEEVKEQKKKKALTADENGAEEGSAKDPTEND